MKLNKLNDSAKAIASLYINVVVTSLSGYEWGMDTLDLANSTFVCLTHQTNCNLSLAKRVMVAVRDAKYKGSPTRGLVQYKHRLYLKMFDRYEKLRGLKERERS